MSKPELVFKDCISIGVNHWSASVAMREAFSLTHAQKLALIESAKSLGINQLLVITTCNRTELFSNEADTSSLIELLVNHTSGTKEQFGEYGFETFGEDAVRHLFEVATGLDAQILGDLQIIKQVKEAYELSKELDIAGSEMHKILQTVFKTHKRVRKETDLGSGSASAASAAVQFAKQHFPNFEDKHVVLVGTGKMGKITCKNLISLGVKKITLVNRTGERAAELAERFDVESAPFEQLPELLEYADLVIAATGAPHSVINAKDIELVSEVGPMRFYIDLSVPRNISSEIDEHPRIAVVNMDDLQNSMDKSFAKRKASIPTVNHIIRHELQELKAWFLQQSLSPQIQQINSDLESIRQEELERIRNQFAPEDWEKIELLTHRMIRKIANSKLEELKEQAFV